MPTAETIFSDFFFSLSNATVLQLLDIALVALVFFIILNLLRRSRATVLLRGMMALLVVFFVVAIFLPLPTFDYLLELALLATLITIPIIFQPELRRFLEDLGRRVGSLNLQQVAAESAVTPLTSTIESLSARCIGALIVLEGNDDLGELMQTGVRVGSRVSSELLLTIFHDGTPLHDGAVIVRGDRVMAAGCVLPVSNRNLYDGQRRLGTRHRAALGMAETSDAMVVVVSEETGAISFARNGALQPGLDKTELRDQIHSFYRRGEQMEEEPALGRLWEQFRDWLRRAVHPPPREDLLPSLGVLLLSGVLALATWGFVNQETNPIREVRVENIDLQLRNMPPRTSLQSDFPDAVSAVVKAPNAVIDSLGAASFQASVSLEGLSPGLHRVPVVVEASVRPVQIVGVSPAGFDVQLVEVISRTIAVELDEANVILTSPALELSGAPVITPTEIVISGAAPLVQEVDSALVALPEVDVAGVSQSVQAVLLVDESGFPVDEVDMAPGRVMVQLDVVQRANARDVGVRVATEGAAPDGYRLARLVVSPARITLLGTEAQLAEVGTAISTLPVDLSQALEDLTLQVPLDLPLGAEALDGNGEVLRSVLVTVDVEARQENRILTRPVEVEGAEELNLSLNPVVVELLVSGPAPLMRELQAEPRLLRIVIEAQQLEGLQAGESILVTPAVVAPAELRVRVTPAQVQVTAPAS